MLNEQVTYINVKLNHMYAPAAVYTSGNVSNI